MDDPKQQERIKELIKLLSMRCDRMKVKDELVAIGKPAVPALIDSALNHKIPPARRGCIWALGKIGDISAIPALLTIIRAHDEKLSGVATQALKNMAQTAVPTLIERLWDPDGGVGADASFALGIIGDPSVIPKLIEILKGDNPFFVRSLAAEIIGSIGHPSAIPALAEAMGDEDKDVQSKACDALLVVLFNIRVNEICTTIESLEKLEENLVEGFARLKKNCKNAEDVMEIGFQIAELKIEITKKKNELTEDKGILLTDIPKPPKKGTIFQSVRKERMSNG